MPKFQKIWQNPPRLAMFRGMVHCYSCAHGTYDNPKFARVYKAGGKGSKNAIARRSGVSQKSSPNPEKDQVASQYPAQGPESQSHGSGSERCHSPGTIGRPEEVIESGSTTCPSWSEVRKYDPTSEFSDIPTEGVGEEWWEILFEDIRIFPIVQPTYLGDHSYAMEPLQDVPSLSH